MSSANARHRVAIVTVILALIGAWGCLPAAGASAAKLGAKQTAALKTTCKYFPYDWESLVGELKMSNLTGQELTEGAHYVSTDLAGARPVLGESAKKQVAQAQAVLARASTVPNSQAVSTREKNLLERTFKAAPFPSLYGAVHAACQRLAKR